MSSELKDFGNLVGFDVFCHFVKTNITAKVIQIIVFVALIFAFTYNHYRLDKPCVQWEKRKSPFADMFGGPSETTFCIKYRFWPNGISSKSGHTHRIPADLIYLFIGAGIIYFTKDIKHK